MRRRRDVVAQLNVWFNTRLTFTINLAQYCCARACGMTIADFGQLQTPLQTTTTLSYPRISRSQHIDRCPAMSDWFFKLVQRSRGCCFFLQMIAARGRDVFVQLIADQHSAGNQQPALQRINLQRWFFIQNWRLIEVIFSSDWLP